MVSNANRGSCVISEVCDGCGKPNQTLYEVEGYTGRSLWCPLCFGPDEDDDPVSGLYEGPPIAPEDVLSVYVVLNGALGMTPGKSAAMAYHCGYQVGAVATSGDVSFAEWIQQGRRVVMRVAETPHVFARVLEECLGYTQRDEGLTEVEHGSIVAFVTIPYRRDSIPRILTHKRCQLYRQ